MKRRNRWLTMLLSVTMVTAQLPVSPVSAAAEDTVSIEETIKEDEAEELTVPDDTEDISVGEEIFTESSEAATAADEEVVEIYDDDETADLTSSAYVKDRVTAVANDEADAERVAAAYNAKVEYYGNGIVFIDLEGSGYTVASAMNAYINSNGTLPEIEPDYIAESALYEEEVTAEEAQYAGGENIPLDFDWSSVYSNLTNPDPSLNPSAAGYQWYHDMIGTYEAWGMSTGSPDIVTCVIADGTKLGHEDLGGMSRIGYLKDQKQVYDKGTPLAGIVGATLDNGRGGAGIAPDSTVYTFDVSDKTGVVTAGNLANAILSVANMELTIKDGVYNFKKLASKPKAQIILIDAQLHASTAKLRNVIKAAHDTMNITFVAPAGDYDSSVQCFPAVYDQVIGVGAVDANGEKTARSSFGDWVSVAAPGYQIYAPSGRGGVSENLSEYRFVSGTSAAAAVVAGVCALYMSTEGWVAPELMKKVLEENVNEVAVVSQNGVRVAPGKGIVSLPEIMGSGLMAARINIYETKSSEFVWKTVNPADSNASTECPSTGYIRFSSLKKTTDKEGKVKYDVELKNIKSTYIYTTDGSDPTVTVSKGKLYTGSKTSVAHNGELYINDILDRTLRGNQSIILKVAVVNGHGRIDKVTAVKINTVYNSKDIISVNIVNVPSTLIAGKSVNLKAEVYYLDENGNYTLHSNQKVKWSVAGSYAKISNQEKGTLKAYKGVSGTVKVTCIADVARKNDDGTGRKEFTVNISSTAVPVKTITLNLKKTELDFDNGIDRQVSANDLNRLAKPAIQDASADAFSVISVNSAVNKDGVEVKDATAFEWKSSKSAVAKIEVLPGGRSVRVIPLKKGTTQISCKALDGSGKTVKCKVTVKHLVTDMTIKGQTSILKGKKATYKAVCTGGFNAAGKKLKPNNKKVTWSLLDMSGKALSIRGVEINETNGKLKVDAYADIQGNTDIYVAATTKDRGHYTELYKVTLMGPGVTKAATVAVRFDKGSVSSQKSFVPTYKKSSTEDLTAIKMHSLDATKGTTAAGEVVLEGFVSNGSKPIWTSSDASVAEIVTLSGNKVKVSGRKTGNATITCDAGDGSGKKAKVKVSVIIPASYITLIDKNLDVYDNGANTGYSYLAKGGSTQLKASLGTVYGTPSVKKVSWDIEIVAFKRNKAADGTYSIATYELNETANSALKNQLYKLDKGNGTVSVAAKKTFDNKSATYAEYYRAVGGEGFAAKINAITTDGTNTVSSRLIVAVDPLEDFRIYNDNADKAVETYTILTSNGLSAAMPVNYRMGEDRELTTFTVRSTDPRIINGYVEITMKGNEQKVTLHFVAASEFANDKTKKEGTADLIVTPNDGSGKQAKLKVTIKKQ